MVDMVLIAGWADSRIAKAGELVLAVEILITLKKARLLYHNNCP
jgi:hypothetical protein